MKKIAGSCSCVAHAVVLGAALALVSTASAVTKTYTQYGFTEVPNIAMDGIPSSTEIGETPQLAFPGVTLDDIHGHQFITELYGGGVDTRATAWGIYPLRHKTGGSVDKLSLQFGVKDGDFTKAVILVLTNGEGGVYVQKFGWCYKSGTSLRFRFNQMNGSGDLSFRTDGDKPDGSDTTGGYQAWGLRIHGMNPVAEARLAFPGAKLASLTNYMFIAGYRMGNGLDNPVENNIATFVTPWPSNDNVQKIVMQLTASESQKTAIIELTEQADGVYARQTHAAYNGTSGAQKFAIDSSGNISLSGNSSGWVATGDGSYSVWEFYGIPNYAYMQTTPRLVWTKKGGVLTLNELAGAKFTALFGGAWVNAGGLKNLTGETLVSGYNTRETIDANGDITEIVTEFEYNESGKTVVVKFTNGADGVYAQALVARNGQTFGYVYSDANGNYYGNSATLATSRTAGGYGVCGLKAIADTAKIYRQGSTHTFAVLNDTPASSTQIPTSATVGFSGMTLEDLASSTFLSYMQSGNISGRWIIGKHAVLYPSSGAAEKLIVQFTTEDGSYKKAAYVQFAYNGNGAITMQKIDNTWSSAGDASTRYFTDNLFTLGPSDASSYQNINGGYNANNMYHLWGMQVFPGFVKTSPTLLFKGATLNDIENATFTARAAGAWLPIIATRVDGYNKHVVKDGDDVTSIVVEFQYADGATVKTVVVKFENGEDGVYGTAIKICWTNTSLGYQFVQYDGEGNISGYNGGNNNTIATSPITGGYGVYDVQAAVEPDANEWTLDQNRNWSYYTGGDEFDDDGATIRVKVTGNGATLTIDENTSVGRIMFVNAAGVDVTTNSLVIGSGVSANIGDIEAGAGTYVNVPVSLGAVPATAGNDATIAYSGDGTVSAVLSGTGAVELRSGRVTFTGANDFTGGFIVRSGAVAVAGAAVGRNVTVGPFGEIDSSVIVEAGGMVDLNGKNGLYYRYTLAGTGVATGGVAAPGPIVNLGGTLDIGRDNWGEWTTGHARRFTLAGDIALGATGYDFGIVSKSAYQEASDECWLDLSDHTLTKTGSGTLYLWAKQFTAVGSGTLSIESGVVNIRKGKYIGRASGIVIGANGTLLTDTQIDVGSIVNNGRIEIAHSPWQYGGIYDYAYSGSTFKGSYTGSGVVAVLANGKLVVDDAITVADFVNNGKPVSGTGMLTVTGTLTPGNAITNLTLASGATVKLTGTNAVQSVTGTFVAAGAVIVDSTAISDEDLKAAGMVPVLSAPSLPADIKQRMAAPGFSKRSFRVETGGGVSTVYMTTSLGFTIFVK